MMTSPTVYTIPKRRRGMTILEVIIAITLIGIIGVSLVQILRTQLRFADRQVATNNAREVSRAALNAFTTDIRMVDADSGVLAAASDSLTVVTPYASGVVCGPNGAGGSVVALLPYDSVNYAEGGYAGYAYIDTTTTGTKYSEVYQYVYTGTTPTSIDSATAATTAPCQTATDNVGIFKAGALVVSPAIPDRSRYKAVILFRKVTYAFRSSSSVAGARGLFRTVVGGTRGTEELVAPFDTTSGFQYYLNTGVKVTSATGATLRLVRGVQLELDGQSENIVPGTTTVQRAPLTTAIFFKNRPLL